MSWWTFIIDRKESIKTRCHPESCSFCWSDCEVILLKELIPLAELFTKEMKWKVGLLNNLFILDKRLCTVVIEEKKTTIWEERKHHAIICLEIVGVYSIHGFTTIFHVLSLSLSVSARFFLFGSSRAGVLCCIIFGSMTARDP